MRGRYQIVLTSRQDGASAGQSLGFWSRFKALLIGVGFLLVAVTVLVVALIFGSVLAAVLWICLVLVCAAVILKTAWRGRKPDRG
jgi:hypothetical protein